MLRALVLFLAVLSVSSDFLMMRHSTAEGGHQARPLTSTDYIAHFCHDSHLPLALKACGADTTTGGNPGIRDPATPMNLYLRCPEGDQLICATPGNNITAMCCEGSLPQGFSPTCSVVVRVFNGGGTITLVTGATDAYFPTSEDLKRLPVAPLTPPPLPRPPDDQVRSLLTSVATMTPVSVPFNDRRRELKDLNFIFCGRTTPTVAVGVAGTALSAESEVFVCEKEMGAMCGAQLNHGTDHNVTVFHTIQTKQLEYAREYFVRVFSFGHQDEKPTIDVIIYNTVVYPPMFVMDRYWQNVAKQS